MLNNIFDKVRSLYNNQKEKNSGFNECPSIDFTNEYNALYEKYYILLSSYMPYGSNNSDEAVFIRLIQFGLKHYGKRKINQLLNKCLWPNQIIEIKSKLENHKIKL